MVAFGARRKSIIPKDERENGAVPRLPVPSAEGLVLHAAVETHVEDHQEDHEEQFYFEQDRISPAATKVQYAAEVRTVVTTVCAFSRAGAPWCAAALEVH